MEKGSFLKGLMKGRIVTYKSESREKRFRQHLLPIPGHGWKKQDRKSSLTPFYPEFGAEPAVAGFPETG